jgi:hypothetical protein
MSALEISVKRFNKYKERMDAARVPIIRAFLHLVRPEEGFPKHTVHYIREVWDEWRLEEISYNAAMKEDYPGMGQKVRVWPEPPDASRAEDACWRMWGIALQEQVEGDSAGYNLQKAVQAVIDTPKCASHPPSCPCKVPNNPWFEKRHVEMLEPLGVKHNAGCWCKSYMVCAQATAPPDNFVKSLFKTVQGVNYDDKCPHGLPFYACMPCSH